MINLKVKNNNNVPVYIIQGLLIVICFVSAALGRWMNYVSLIACVVFFVIFLYQNKKTISLSYINIGWCLFFLIYSVCDNLLCNGTNVDTYFFFNYIVIILFLLFVGQNINIIKLVLLLLNLFCLCEAVFVILQEYAYSIWVKLGWTIVGYGSSRISGFMSDYSISGFVLAIGVILAFYTVKNKYLKIIAVAINFFALLLTTKRSHLLILFIGIIVLYFINSKNKKVAFFKSLALIIAISLISYMFYFYSDSNNAIVRLIDTILGYLGGEDITELSSNRDVLYAETISFWQTSIVTIIFGNGWGFFSNNVSVFNSSVSTSHNVYLQLLCETGLIGFMFFVILGICAIYRSVMNVVNIKNRTIRGYAIITCYIQFHFLAYCFLGSPLYDTACLFIYIIAVAFSEYLYCGYVKHSKKHRLKVII